MKSKIITIAGLVGSGKTSTSNGVAKEFGYRRFSAGDFQRATAESLGLPYDEYQKLAEQDPQYDRKADTALENAGKDSEIVIDAPEIAAQRILKDAEANPAREKENQQRITSPEEMVKSINDRYESERLRYNKYYNITDYHDPKDFDLYIDTSIHPLVKVIQMIVEGYKEWLAS
jgi:cytidylate kinase